jgi:dimethylargininase
MWDCPAGPILPESGSWNSFWNHVWINGRVLVPAGFEKTRDRIEAHGYDTLAVDVSEFQKLDGGLSCLSLRF